MNEKEQYTSRTGSFFQSLPWILSRLFSRRIKKSNTKYFIKTDPAVLHAPVQSGRTRVTWLGHASLIIQTDTGVTIVTDPIFKKKIAYTVPRITDIPLLPKDMPSVDICLLSHDHYDHLDTDALGMLAPKLIVGGEKIQTALPRNANAIGLSWWQSVKAGDITLTFVPARHWSKRGLEKRNKRLWGGFVIETGTHTIYFAGDTSWCDVGARVAERFPAIDLAVIPIGAYKPDLIKEFHLSPDQAVDFYTQTGAKAFLPIHWGTYDLSEELAYDAVNDLATAWEKKGLPESARRVLSVGETIEL